MKAAWLMIALLPLAAAAQTVYESKEPSGVPEYSDRPSPGAKEIQLPPLTVVPAPKSPEGQPQPQPPGKTPNGYRALRIISPENEETVRSSTGQFDVRVELSPALRTMRGDAIILRFNGTAVPRKFRNVFLEVIPEDWESEPAAVNEPRIQAAVVDRDGKVLIESEPVQFFLRRPGR